MAGLFGLGSKKEAGSFSRAGSPPIDSSEKIKEVILGVARALVDDPDALEATIEQEDEIQKIKLTAAKGDLGKIIGKDGRMATALRTIVYALGSKTKTRMILEIS